jgi:hypothetical protein
MGTAGAPCRRSSPFPCWRRVRRGCDEGSRCYGPRVAPNLLVLLVVGATLVGAALGGLGTGILFAVVAAVVAAILQIRAVGRPKR